MPTLQISIYPTGYRPPSLPNRVNHGGKNGKDNCSWYRSIYIRTWLTPSTKFLMTKWVSSQHLVFSLLLTPSATDSSIWQVDDPAPSMSRSGWSFDLRPVSPVSYIGHNALTLVALMHRGACFKKMTTKRSKATPSIAAATLAQAFKVKTVNYFMLTSAHT